MPVNTALYLKNHMNPITKINEAIEYIESFNDKPEKLLLAISDTLQDPAGMNMALITDSILEKGWEPNGFKQENGYRVYFYKMME